MVNNSENILVEFDYQNISLIDPNKVIDDDGKIKERLIQHENLVYYANLECSLTPRTKLAIGVPQGESIQTVSVAKINFLNPGFRDYLDTQDTNELTGKGTLKGEGVNQPRQTVTKNPDLSDDYYVNQTLMSHGEPGAIDNGLLGITQINISYGLDFMAEVNITMEDVKGRALFEAGNNSPYAAFFNLPYPLFYLTVKGYLGKAVRIPLMMQTFNASFAPDSHNFRIQCKFYTYKYSIMGDVTWGQMMAVPQMYRIKIDSPAKTSTDATNAKTNTVTKYSSGGYQKMRELYAEYKAKGLIDDNFPEITILELKKRLGQLITTIQDNFRKKNLNVLNDINKYSTNLGDFSVDVYLGASTQTWSRKWLDYRNVFIYNDTQKTVLYRFKEEFSDPDKQNEAFTELEGIIKKYTTLLTSNVVIGKEISVPVTKKTFVKPVTISNINVAETMFKRSGEKLDIGTEKYGKSKQQLNNEILNSIKVGNNPGLFFFTGPNSFQEIIKSMDEKYLNLKQKIETDLTKDIEREFANPNNGLGFQPTIRNVLAVFFAQGEAFLRMMDDVHSLAWDLRDDDNRRRAVFDSTSTVKSVDFKYNEVDQPVYPWPQLIVENLIEGKEKYELKYPGDFIIANKINAFVPEIWPEVQFVEEYIRGFVEREDPSFDFGDAGNDVTKPLRFSFNGIEFTIGNDVYRNTEEIKFFYEIYERMYLNSFYSKFNRQSIKKYNIKSYVAESETTNLLTALGTSNPLLSKKIKEYNINSQIYGAFMRHISNNGEGLAWQNFIRGNFNTPYLKNDTDVSFQFFKGDILNSNPALPNVGLEKNEQVVSYFGEDIISENFDFTDLYPLTDIQWCKDYLANGKAIQSQSDIFKTNTTLQYDTSIKTIRNKDNIYPITNFNYKQSVFNQDLNLSNLTNFYETRKISQQYTTEGNVNYVGYNGNVTNRQTTSIFNTPYFSNAIQKGNYEFRYSLLETSPYKAAAYLFLNSLPLATLRDKYKRYNDDGTVSTLDYILPSLKKFGAVHEMPYAWVLKYGSIWHRYKKYKENGVDILDEIWNDTDYIGNYDPYFSASTTQYQVNISGETYNIVLDADVAVGNNVQTRISTGFYPRLLDDYNLFLQGKPLFSQSNTILGYGYFSGNTLEVTSINYNNLAEGIILSGNNIDLNTTIVSQTAGTPGGIGTYIVEPSQSVPFIDTNVSTVLFRVTNATTGGYSSGGIQSKLNTDFRMVLSDSSIITKGQGFDALDLDRSLSVLPWSCYVFTPEKDEVYLLPSLGSNVNQTAKECFNDNGRERIDLRQNPSIHNGATRLFWKAPNYGYFDNENLIKPEPDEYMREVFSNQEEQENFGIFGSQNYSKISELFTTFSPEILDLFEQQFLNFSKSIYDFESSLTPRKEDTSIETRNENFQGLMREMFKTPYTTGLNGSALITKLTEDQKNNIQKVIDEFMNYMVVFKYGNPSNFDKKLFYTFSTDFIEDPFLWQGYVANSPDVLPYAGGTITLAQSKQQYPETWDALETYVGFSEIPQLVYSDNGSYITDFFVEMDVEFSVTNIIRFAPIIKMYATQKLNGFQKYNDNVTVQQPQPQPIVNPPNPLPPPNPQTPGFVFIQSKLLDSNSVYIYKNGQFIYGVLQTQTYQILLQTVPTLETQTTPSDIVTSLIIQYYGSTTTDATQPQFIVQSLSFLPPQTTTTTTQTPIEKLFNQPTSNSGFDNGTNMSKFFNLMNDYITNGEKYLNLILDDTLIRTRAKLGNVNVTTENTGVKYTEFNGEQTRLEIWESLKSINDKWISGGDLKTKTLFEDVMLMDRASRDIGQKIFVDIFKLKDLIEYMDYNNFMLGVIQTIFTDNRFTPFVLPSYANFYNVQDVSKNASPRPEGTLQFANNLFGTFLDVDYRDTSSKYIAIYAYVPSTHLAMNENVDYRYRDDAFDLRRASDNPLIESQDGKNDWDKSNKVVGFNVDIGPQNQQIFKQLDIAQDPGKPTAESEQMLTQMANTYRNRGGTSQSVSLYNVYKNRSYRCSIDMLGNAMIQPTMYFNLRNVPLFSGPYMITNVSHRISENGFDTTFEGQRQPFYSIPAIDTLLQSLTSKILETLKEKLEQQDKEINEQNNILAQKSDIINRINSEKNVLTTNQNCQSNLNSTFAEFTNTTPTTTSISFKEANDVITKKINTLSIGNTAKGKLWHFIIGTMYVETGEGNKYTSKDNNYASVNLNINPWGGSSTYFNKKYFCVNRGNNQNIPLASFDSFDIFIDFFIAKFKSKVNGIGQYTLDEPEKYRVELAKANTIYWPENLEESVWTSLNEQEKKKLENKIAIPIEYIIAQNGS